MPKLAFSYARFSSSGQQFGDFERRQLEDTRRYAEEKGFLIDESLGVDRGLSGFTGDNLTIGVLKLFISKARKNRS
jgi:hypothetical protein